MTVTLKLVFLSLHQRGTLCLSLNFLRRDSQQNPNNACGCIYDSKYLQGVWQVIANFLWKKSTILLLIIGIDDSHKNKIEEKCS